MKTHLKYLRYFIRHKWYVFLECLKYRLIWRGIIHDWTKALPIEWGAYANRYYGQHDQAKFDRAQNHHHKHNDHHWQYWVYLNDSGEQIALAMTDAARKELLADWRGANRAIGLQESELIEWYLENYEIFHFHPETRAWLDRELAVKHTSH
jgi:hypothetical protein